MILFAIFVFVCMLFVCPALAILWIGVPVVILLYILIKGHNNLKKDGYFERIGEKPWW